ncbi:MAG: hypothetical protein NZ519_05945 [Bacteroidia bacterium]|nr:hypothetical protein [Bacteroidia bacterium]
MYLKLKRGKDIIAKVNCVRGMEHAVRQCEVLAKHRSEAQCGMPRPLRSKGHAQKNKISYQTYYIVCKVYYTNIKKALQNVRRTF